MIRNTFLQLLLLGVIFGWCVPLLAEGKMGSRFDELKRIIERYNNPLIKEAREYYDSEDSDKRESSFEVHLQKYGQHVKIGKKCDQASIDLYEDLAGIPVPPELREFWLSFGEIKHHEHLRVFSVDFFVERLSNPQRFSPYDRIDSGGLIDMILHSWGRDRRELQPEGQSKAFITTEELKYLNTKYKVVGSYNINGSFEDFYYIYFDESGRFGTVYYHQDRPRELRSKYLEPLLKKSLASSSLSEILVKALEEIIKDQQEES